MTPQLPDRSGLLEVTSGPRQDKKIETVTATHTLLLTRFRLSARRSPSRKEPSRRVLANAPGAPSANLMVTLGADKKISNSTVNPEKDYTATSHQHQAEADSTLSTTINPEPAVHDDSGSEAHAVHDDLPSPPRRRRLRSPPRPRRLGSEAHPVDHDSR